MAARLSFRLKDLGGDQMKPGFGKLAIPMAQVVAAGLAASVAGSAMASSPVLIDASGPSHTQVVPLWEPQQFAEEGFLAERMRKVQEAKIDEVAADVKNNPKVLDDPKYLAAHPRLASYLEKHPDAKDKIKQDPTAFFQHLKEESRNGTGG